MRYIEAQHVTKDNILSVEGVPRRIRRIRHYPETNDGIRRIRFELRGGGGVTKRHRTRMAVLA